MDTFSVKMILISTSASTFVIELNGVEGENEQHAAQMAMLHVMKNGADVSPSAGMPNINIKPAFAVPFDCKKISLISVASSLPGGLVRP